MAWMRSSLTAFLALALGAGGAAAARAATYTSPAKPTKLPSAVPAPPASGVTASVVAPKAGEAKAGAKGEPEAGTVTVHRCTDARGQVTLQDDPCPAGSRAETRAMTRPKDPPVNPKAVKVADTPAMPQPELVDAEAPPRLPIPPPPMYKCTSYDGDERFSESYDPNPRCEPLVIYYPYPNQLTPQQALGCRWVEDSCVRLSDRAACARWIQMRKDAASAATRAFSDTAAYRKSELERLTQIVEESCF